MKHFIIVFHELNPSIPTLRFNKHGTIVRTKKESMGARQPPYIGIHDFKIFEKNI